jgi:oligosaccharyltransferase complex subunit gamma
VAVPAVDTFDDRASIDHDLSIAPNPQNNDAARATSFKMRLQSIFLSVTLLLAGAMGAKKSSTERFNTFHSKALSSSPIKLSQATYKSITSAPRDYTVAVLLTALEARFSCQLCREFQPEYDLLSKSWTKGDKSGESRLLFTSLDFVDGKDVFVSVCLSPQHLARLSMN